MLERAGASGATVMELPIGQHVASLVAGQVDACYTLEPTGTIGRMNGTTRIIEAGVVAKYILGDPMAPVARRRSQPDQRIHQEEPRGGQEIHRRLRPRHRAGAHQAGRSAAVHEGLHRHRRRAHRPRCRWPRTCCTTSSSPATWRTSRSSTTCSPKRASSRRRSRRGRQPDLQGLKGRAMAETTSTTAGAWSPPAGPRPASAAPKTHRLGQAAALRRPPGPVHRLGPGGAAGLHQAHPAATTRRHWCSRWSPAWRAGRCCWTSP